MATESSSIYTIGPLVPYRVVVSRLPEFHANSCGSEQNLESLSGPHICNFPFVDSKIRKGGTMPEAKHCQEINGAKLCLRLPHSIVISRAYKENRGPRRVAAAALVMIKFLRVSSNMKIDPTVAI